MPLVDFADAAGLRFIQVCSVRVKIKSLIVFL